MNRPSYHLTAVLLVVMLFAFAVGAQVWAGQYMTLLHFNDLHGHLEAFAQNDVSVGGMARIATAIQQVEAWNDDHQVVTLLLNAGDVLQGTAMSTMFQGQPDFWCLNEIGTDAMCLGNHEFDFGQQVLSQRMKQATFPILAANITRQQSGLGVTAYCYVTELRGVKTGIFGLTTADTPTTTARDNVAGLEFHDPVTVARQMVEFLGGRADFIIALTHLGFPQDIELARAVPEIDVIIGGHSHTALQQPEVVGNTLIVQAGAHGLYLGQLDLYVEAGDVSKYRGFLRSIDDRITPDPKIAAFVGRYAEKVEAQLGEVIATATVHLDGEREAVRSRETNLGDLLCDITREYARTDIALLNGGGIRAPIAAGPVTARDVITVLPFGNDLVRVALTGEQVRQLLDRSASLPAGDGGFLQVSGLRYRISNGQATDIKVGGIQIDPDRRYTVVTTDFLFTGGDGYTIFEQGEDPYPYGVRLSSIVIQALRELGMIQTQVDGRIAGASD